MDRGSVFDGLLFGLTGPTRQTELFGRKQSTPQTGHQNVLPLVEIATHSSGQGNLAYADQLMQLARAGAEEG